MSKMTKEEALEEYKKHLRENVTYMGFGQAILDLIEKDKVARFVISALAQEVYIADKEVKKLKRIVEVYEKSNNLYAEYGNDNPDSIYNFETARQAKEEVERIRGEGK